MIKTVQKHETGPPKNGTNETKGREKTTKITNKRTNERTKRNERSRKRITKDNDVVLANNAGAGNTERAYSA